ncbi:LAFA_0A03224g1_1 [Lachancea sp. 'fantastica']|nr:LAFA_0A03224g1_1 [Lachancea sp. 'fantastica']
MEPKGTTKGVTLYRERFSFGEKPGIGTSDTAAAAAAAMQEPQASHTTKNQSKTTSASTGNSHYTHMTTTAAAPVREPTSSPMDPSSTKPTARPSLPGHTSSSSSWSSLSSTLSANNNNTYTNTGNRGITSRRLSSEEIINEMEKEQDAIVVRLLREIDQLKDENNRLRKNLCSVLNGDPHTAIHTTTTAPHTTLPQLSRRSSLNSNASSGSSTSLNNSITNISTNTNNQGPSTHSSSLASSSVLAMTPNKTSPVPSRRPSSSAAPIDTVTPTLLLQRKRNSVPSSVPLTPKKSDEFAHLYAPVPTHKSCVAPGTTVDLTEGSGFRRRRSSMKAFEGSNKIPRSTR